MSLTHCSGSGCLGTPRAQVGCEEGAGQGGSGELGGSWSVSPAASPSPAAGLVSGFCCHLPLVQRLVPPLSFAENLHPQHHQQEDQGRVSGLVSVSLGCGGGFRRRVPARRGVTVPRGEPAARGVTGHLAAPQAQGRCICQEGEEGAGARAAARRAWPGPGPARGHPVPLHLRAGTC